MEEYKKRIQGMLLEMNESDALFIKQIYTIISRYKKRRTQKGGEREQ